MPAAISRTPYLFSSCFRAAVWLAIWVAHTDFINSNRIWGCLGMGGVLRSIVIDNLYAKHAAAAGMHSVAEL